MAALRLHDVGGRCARVELRVAALSRERRRFSNAAPARAQEEAFFFNRESEALALRLLLLLQLRWSWGGERSAARGGRLDEQR